MISYIFVYIHLRRYRGASKRQARADAVWHYAPDPTPFHILGQIA